LTGCNIQSRDKMKAWDYASVIYMLLCICLY